MIVFLDKNDQLPDPLLPRRDDTLAFSQDLTAERMIEAYPQGIFPYFAYKDKFVRWCAPRERYVIFPDEIHISHSMRNIMNRNIYRVTINENFEEVIWACAKVDGRIFEDGAWLGPELIQIWIELHRRGYAKSVEVWNEDNELVGGLYGFAHGGCFMGDSMFSKEKDGYWIHTRGMAEFGRPDYGISKARNNARYNRIRNINKHAKRKI